MRNKVLGRPRVSVQAEPTPFYWHSGNDAKAHWSILKPLGIDVVNLIQNPSFEASEDGWGTINGGSQSRITTDAAYGGISLQLAPPASGQPIQVIYGSGFGFTSPFPFIGIGCGPNDNLYACVAVKGCFGDTLKVQLIIDGIVIPAPPYGIATEEKATGEWQTICAEYKGIRTLIFPACGANIALLVESDNRSGCNIMLIDGALMSREKISSYFDGDVPGATWSGAPHVSESVISRFSCNVGERINFIDLGLDFYSDEGWGLPPVENITTSFARQDGAHYQRTRANPRVLTFTAIINGCNSPTELHTKRAALIRSLLSRFRKQCACPLTLCYQLVNSCGEPISSELYLDVVYENGLMGVRRVESEERVAVQFVAHDDPFFYRPYDSSAEITVVDSGDPTTTSVIYNGTEDVFPIIDIRGNTLTPVHITTLRNVTTQINLVMGVPTPSFEIPINMRLQIDTGGPTARLLPLPGLGGVETDVTSQINFPLSRANLWRLVEGENFIRLIGDAGVQAFMTWRDRHVSADFVDIYRECR